MGSYGFTESMLDAHRMQRARRVAKADGHPVKPLERDVQSAVLELLEHHPKVAVFWRQNTGGFTDKRGQYVKFGFTGCSDVLGMLKGGRFLAFECKREGESLTPDQAAFLANVQRNGGLAGCVRSVEDAQALLRIA